jgi:poly(A) polymerase
LLFRYGTTHRGTIERKAQIYTQEEHGIDVRLVDADAVWIVRRLRKEGFHAYIVGGAVRDLMTGRTPNDFDIATDARPQQIKRLFRSARVIGRRFRIVHIYMSREKYIEVTTFRSRSALGTAEHLDHPDMNNLFGTIDEDAERRDFTINALYYCPVDRQVIDYVGGYRDLKQKKLRTLGKADASFAEDPVRMIRAVKYASLLGFTLPLGMASLIRRMAGSLLDCSRERVTEEVYKILTSGGAEAMLDLAYRLRMFDVVFPILARGMRESRARFSDTPLGRRLHELDAATAQGRSLDRNEMFGFLFHDIVVAHRELLEAEDPSLAIQQHIRSVSEPLFPSKKDLITGAESLLRELQPHHRARPAAGPHAPRRAEHAPGADQAGKRKRRRRGGRGRRRPGGPGAGPASAGPAPVSG